MNSLRALVLSLATLVGFCIATPAQTWDGGSAVDSNFNTPNNWNPNAVPANNGTASLIFAGVTRLTPVVNLNFDVNSVTFNNTAGAFSISQNGGSALTVRGGGIANNDADTQTFTTPVNFASGSAISATAGNLNFTGTLGLGVNTVTISGAFDTDLDAITGTGVLVKNGSGALNISPSGNQQYGLTINAGTVSYASSATFVGATAVTSVAGGTLEMLSNFTLSSGASLDVAAAATFTLPANRTMTVQSASSVTYNDVLPTPANATYRVTGTGSTFATGGFALRDGSVIEVLSGGAFTTTGASLIGAFGTTGSIVVDGTTSSFTGSSTFAVGDGVGSIGSLIFNNGASGSFPSVSVTLGRSGATSGTMTVKGGADVSAGTFEVAHVTSSGTANLLVTGPGSTLTATFNVADFSIGATSGSVGTVTVSDSGEIDLAGPLTINETGTLNLNGGIISMASGQPFVNNGTFNFNAGRFSLGNNLNVGGGASPLGINLTLPPGREVVLPGTRTTTVAAPGSLVLNGGLFQTGALINNGGTIDFLLGTLRITGSSGLTIGSSGPLGGNVTVPSGATLEVSSSTTVASDALLVVDGGSFNSGNLTNNGSVIIEAGTTSVSLIANNSGAQLFVERNLSTASTLNNASGATLELFKGTGRLAGAGALQNHGLLSGNGTILKPVTNAVTGKIRVSGNETLLFSGSFSPNNGELNLQGGTLDFFGPITNAVGGFIAGRGSLYTGGLTNQGQMAFSGGNADIHGDVTLTPGSRVVTGGAGAVTTFFDDVVHNGLEIFTGAGGSTVFFGNLTGTGPFTGTGTVYSIGDLRPGASPANVSFGGDLILGFFARTVIEIGGLVSGTQHDRLSVAHTLELGGTLEVQLINGFIPSVGQNFKILDAAPLKGGFSGVTLPALPPGRFWRTDFLATTGVLAVAVVPATFGEFSTAYGLVEGPDGDDDDDQLSNALEFLLGSNPQDSASAPHPDFARNGLESVFSFTLPELPGATSKFVIESSPDLQTWTALATKTGLDPWTGGVSIGAPLNGIVSATLASTDAAPQRFYRVRARLE